MWQRMSTIMDVRMTTMKEALVAQCHFKFPNPDKMVKILATGNLRKISWPVFWSATNKGMWGSTVEGSSRSVPWRDREAWLNAVWPAMGRAYGVAHPWDSPFDWAKILDQSCRCLRSFDTVNGERVNMTDDLWRAAWAAASQVRARKPPSAGPGGGSRGTSRLRDGAGVHGGGDYTDARQGQVRQRPPLLQEVRAQKRSRWQPPQGQGRWS